METRRRLIALAAIWAVTGVIYIEGDDPTLNWPGQYPWIENISKSYRFNETLLNATIRLFPWANTTSFNQLVVNVSSLQNNVSNAINNISSLQYNVTDLHNSVSTNASSLDSLIGNVSALTLNLTTIYYNASSINETASGTVTRAGVEFIRGYDDGFQYNVTEGTGTSAMNQVINFTGVASFNNILFNIWYKVPSTTSHTIVLGVYDYTSGLYEEEYGSLEPSSNYVGRIITVLDSGSHLSADGNVSIQLRHSGSGATSHMISIDWLSISQGSAGYITSQHNGLSGRSLFDTNHPLYARNLTNLDAWVAAINGSVAKWDNLVSAGAAQPNIDGANITSGTVPNQAMNASYIVNKTYSDALYAPLASTNDFNDKAWINQFGSITSNVSVNSGNVNVTGNLQSKNLLLELPNNGRGIIHENLSSYYSVRYLDINANPDKISNLYRARMDVNDHLLLMNTQVNPWPAAANTLPTANMIFTVGATSSVVRMNQASGYGEFFKYNASSSSGIFRILNTDGDLVLMGDNQQNNYTVVGDNPSAIYPSVTNGVDLGTTSLRWRNIYSTNAVTVGDLFFDKNSEYLIREIEKPDGIYRQYIPRSFLQKRLITFQIPDGMGGIKTVTEESYGGADEWIAIGEINWNTTKKILMTYDGDVKADGVSLKETLAKYVELKANYTDLAAKVKVLEAKIPK